MRITQHWKFEDIKIIDLFSALDYRGEFIKIYNDNIYRKLGINMDIRESFYSLSHKNVIRGLHFQMPPHAHNKLVHVIHGSVLDVVVDLRKQSSYYKKAVSIELTDKEPRAIYIPQGFAHGFKSLEDNTLILYNVSKGYEKVSDFGVRWDTIEFNWGIENPIVSERDNSFISLEDFDSPF
jgi:dTDP-4-dehydrorhamnose 3,5-epimerase/CDP-3, 6-dideoxy-D-glycero-D-glycero-4-hexulose-5-epimerase